MTFTKEEIKSFEVDLDDEWQDNNGDCDVKIFVGDSVFTRVLNFFGKTVDEYAETDWWIDYYATIDPVKKIVTGLYIHFEMNGDEDGNPTELDIRFTNVKEQKDIYESLAKSGGEEFEEFIDTCWISAKEKER